MNGLLLEIENCNLDMYADNSTLEVNTRAVEQLEQRLAFKDMANVKYWCLLNKMVLIMKKTKTMLITTYHTPHKLFLRKLTSVLTVIH